MTIDPKISYWINLIVGLLSWLAGATALLTPVFGESTTHYVVAMCGLIVGLWAQVNTVLHGVSAPTEGPLVK